MTPDQWHHIRTTVLTNWGSTSKWAKAADLYPDVRALPYDIMRQVVTDIRDSGREHAPTPGEIIGLTKQRTGPLTPNHRPEPTECAHPTIAIVAYATEDQTSPDYLTPTERMCAACLTDLPNRTMEIAR